MHMALLNAVDLRLRAAEIVVTGEGALAQTLCSRAARAHAAARSHRAARRARRTRCRPTSGPRKDCAASGAAAFVCVGETCSLPVTDPAGLNSAIEAMRHT